MRKGERQNTNSLLGGSTAIQARLPLPKGGLVMPQVSRWCPDAKCPSLIDHHLLSTYFLFPVYVNLTHILRSWHTNLSFISLQEWLINTIQNDSLISGLSSVSWGFCLHILPFLNAHINALPTLPHCSILFYFSYRTYYYIKQIYVHSTTHNSQIYLRLPFLFTGLFLELINFLDYNSFTKKKMWQMNE